MQCQRILVPLLLKKMKGVFAERLSSPSMKVWNQTERPREATVYLT